MAGGGQNVTLGIVDGAINNASSGRQDESNGAGSARSPPYNIYKEFSYACTCALLTCCFFGLLGNIASIIVFVQRQMRTVSINVLLCGLSVTDLCVVLLAIPSFGLTGVGSYFQDQTIFVWYPYIIYSTYPMAMIAQTCSVWIFVVITVERYNAVCYPLRARRFSTKRALMSLATIFVVAVVYNAVRIWEYAISKDPRDPEGPIKLFLKKEPVYMKLYFTAMYLLFLFMIPFSILAVLNWHIIRAIRRASKERQTLSRQQVTEHKTTLMMIIITAMFAICNALPFALNIAETINPNFFVKRYHPNGTAVSHPVYNDTAYLLLDLSNLLVALNSSTTSVIYWHFSQRYRLLCSLLFKCRLCFAGYAEVSTTIEKLGLASRSSAGGMSTMGGGGHTTSSSYVLYNNGPYSPDSRSRYVGDSSPTLGWRRSLRYPKVSRSEEILKSSTENLETAVITNGSAGLRKLVVKEGDHGFLTIHSASPRRVSAKELFFR